MVVNQKVTIHIGKIIMKHTLSIKTIKQARMVARLISTYTDKEINDLLIYVSIRFVSFGMVIGITIGVAICTLIAWSKT